MIVDPVEALLKTTHAGGILPTATPTDVAPIPSVLPDVPIHQFVGHSGTTTLWVVFALMVIASATFAGLSLRVAVSNRVFHVITTLITTIAALSYFTMATGQGVTVKHITIHHAHDHVPDTFEHIYRQIFWARYVDWVLTTPLLLLDLGILAGLNGAHLLIAIIADVIMVLFGLFAAVGNESTPQKWGNYSIAIIAFLVVIWHLAINGRNTVRAKSGNVANFYGALAAYTLIIWAAYPIVWGLGDGARRLSVDGEIIAYAVLDVLAKGGFGAWLLFMHSRVPETNVKLDGFWSTGLDREGLVRLDEEDGA